VLRVEHVRVEGIVAHEGRANWREAGEALLVGPSRMYNGIVVYLERVDGEGDLGLRGWEGGRLHGVHVERVLVEIGLGLGVGGYHNAVDGGDQRRGFCSPLGGLIRR
jgi:hypothetical protein